MEGTLYRYPHPYDLDKFIYVGQETNHKRPRDQQHRSGETSFGQRFRKLFPGVELPQPIKQAVEVADHLELNELETIWMFIYKTWRGYEGGMNLVLPGSTNYKRHSMLGVAALKELGHPGSHKSGRIAVDSGHISVLGRKQGQINAVSGHCARIASLGGRAQVENGHMTKMRELPQTKEAQKRTGKIVGQNKVKSGMWAKIQQLPQSIEGRARGLAKINCFRWSLSRGKPCVCNQHNLTSDFRKKPQIQSDYISALSAN